MGLAVFHEVFSTFKLNMENILWNNVNPQNTIMDVNNLKFPTISQRSPHSNCSSQFEKLLISQAWVQF